MWQFTIIDYTQNPTNPQSTIIQEPIGWDAVNLHLKRDETGHGFFGFEDDTFSSLQYDGNGAAILRAAYYTQGIQAKVQLAVTYNCDGQDPDNNLYLGTFDFTTFKDYVADRCYVECATVVNESYYLFKNRKDQQVDLDSLASFDQLPVQQSVACSANFQPGSALIGQQYGTIQVSQLLNGLMPGSQIVIIGSSNNSGVFTVASAKPGYANVNPDLSSGTGSASTIIVSATFNPANQTISINQLINVAVGDTVTTTNASFPAPNAGQVYDNSGAYKVLAIQQFFNYTVLTVSVISMGNTDTNCLNGSGTGGTNTMVTSTEDSVLLQANFHYTSQPTTTVITVAEALTAEQAGATFSGAISGTTLTVTNVQGTVAPGQVITGGNGVLAGTQIINYGTGAGGNGTYIINNTQNISTPVSMATGIIINGQWLQNNLQAYAGLSKIITMPAKQIVADSLYRNAESLIYDLSLVSNPGSGPGHNPAFPISPIRALITPALPNIISDIDETQVGNGKPVFQFTSSDTPDTLIYFRQQALACTGTASIKYSINYSFLPYNSSDPHNWTVSSAGAAAHFVVQMGTDPTDQNTWTHLISESLSESGGTASGEMDNVVVAPGTYIWMWFAISVINPTDSYYPLLEIGPQSSFEVALTSQCADTPCSVYLVNEALSRCVESYTNGDIQVYSDYFGRKNAQPVASAADGCGGLACITNGLRIRGCTVPDGSAIPKFFTSLDDMFTALDAIHNIGMGMEPDPHRPGMLRLRVEPFEYWFPGTFIPLPDVPTLTRRF